MPSAAVSDDGHLATYATSGGSTPWRCMTSAIAAGGAASVARKLSTSSTSALTATDLLPSTATWSATLVPPIPLTVSVRSALNESHASTSATLWVMTSLG